MKLGERTERVRSLRAARVGVFSALYVVTSLVPISIFIGAPSFLALNLILTPTIAVLLPPTEACLAAFFGGLISLYVAPSQAMFGPFTFLLPVAGATFGSLAFHNRKLGGVAAGIFLAASIAAYLVKNYPFPYFVLPHSLAIVIILVAFLRRMTPLPLKIPLYAFVSTMCEQGMMMIFAVHLLSLPWQVFPGILPLMLYERFIGTLGGALIILSLAKALPQHIGQTEMKSNPSD